MAKQEEPPKDMERYFKPGQAIYRGERRDVPSDIHTPEQMVEHLFPGGVMSTGHSWSTHPSIANRFANKDPRTNEGQTLRLVLHSEVDHKTISFDNGHINDDEGNRRNWSSGTDWKDRHSGGGKGHGWLGEEEILMKAKTHVPITGITMRFGSHMSHKQFDPPMQAQTSFPARH